MRRRSLLLGGAAGAVGLTLLARPRDAGENHAPYFEQLGTALDTAGHSGPTLVIDRQRLHDNVATLQSHIDQRFHYRIVAKSLPSPDLLQEVMKQSGSQRLMLFHQPFINIVAQRFPGADILLGKPMPVAAAHNFYRQFSTGTFQPALQLRWLLDTPERVAQYAELAQQLNTPMLACIELDVGLHRGGVTRDEDLIAMLDQIQHSPQLSFCGFMGYEPHVVKVPGDALQYRDAAMARYSHYLQIARQHLGDAWPRDAVLNAGGSPTYQLYDEGAFPFNELAAGSCLVKPTDFDLPSLDDHVAASYIATPVLKTADSTRIPGIDLGPLQRLWNPNRERAIFTYGGYWKALPESPRGLSTNGLYGRSTNQEMLNGSASITLQPDDWVFLRPTQSEFVFLQFGAIAVYEAGAISAHWPVFSENS
ncbi:MAG: DSD1 family PLP-dependent enzyme [Gammaproteobacteria bacterium]|nr:DSD1 family PLP-dependent enzyme [Gammaproteobacteria bacterium]